MTGDVMNPATRRLIEGTRRALDGTGYEVEHTQDGFRVHRERGTEPGAPGARESARSGYEFHADEATRQLTLAAEVESTRTGRTWTWNRSIPLAGSGSDGSWVTVSAGALNVPQVVMGVAHEHGWTELPMSVKIKRKLVSLAAPASLVVLLAGGVLVFLLVLLIVATS